MKVHHRIATISILIASVVPCAQLSAQPSAAEIAQLRQRGERFGLTNAQVAEVYAFIDRNQSLINTAAREKGVNERAFRAIALELGLRNPGADPSRLIEAIRGRVDEAAKFEDENKRLRAQFDALADVTLRQPAQAILDRSNAAYEAGDLETAQQELNALLELRGGALSQSRDAFDAAIASAMALASSRGDLATLDKLDAESEAVYLRLEAATRRARWQNKITRAVAYLTQGEYLGDNAALEKAISIYQDEALPLAVRETVPEDWARTHFDLALAQQLLGERETTVTRLEAAVTNYRRTQEVWTREQAPIDWAESEINIGNTQQRIGERENSGEEFKAAVAAYEAALEVLPRKEEPFRWASGQANRALALHRLGERESGTERLKEAVFSYRLVLEVITRAVSPLDWATIQNNLAAALLVIGERDADLAALRESLTALSLALEEQDRTKVPLQWARSQDNHGSVQRILGDLTQDPAYLDAAIISHQLALEEWTREKVPLDWALGQSNFAHALALLADRNVQEANLEAAWRELNLAAPQILSSHSAPLIARGQFVAQLCRTIAAKHGWPLSDMRASGGFEGTPP